MTQKIRKLGRILSKLLPTGTILPIISGPLKGYKWIVGAAAGEGKGLSTIFNLGEPEQFAIAKSLSHQNGTVFDIGANVGLYSLLFSKYSDQVYAFEPLPRNLKYLYEGIKNNNITNISIVPCAVSDSHGLLKFSEGDNCAIGKISEFGQYVVIGISLDQFVDAYKQIPHLIKIDVEGAELNVLKGSSQLLHNYHPTILLSTHSELLKTQCLDYLESLDYQRIIPLNSHSIEEATEFALIYRNPG